MQMTTKLKMSGNEVFKVAVKTLEEIAIDALVKANLESKDIDWFIPHQANMRIIQAVAKRLELPEEKVILSMDIHGNTSAVLIPLAFDRAIQDGRIKEGDTILMQSFGGFYLG